MPEDDDTRRVDPRHRACVVDGRARIVELAERELVVPWISVFTAQRGCEDDKPGVEKRRAAADVLWIERESAVQVHERRMLAATRERHVRRSSDEPAQHPSGR